MSNNLERFTGRARLTLALAQTAAEQLQHNFIGTGHILLGLLREPSGIAGNVLRNLRFEEKRVEELIIELSKETERFPTIGAVQLAPQTKKILVLAVDEARRLGRKTIDTEHLLLGLVRQTDGEAIDVIVRYGFRPDEVRHHVRLMLLERPVKRTSGISISSVRVTKRGRLALALAQESAEQLNHNIIATEHLLLGIMREEHGVGARVLRDLGLDQQQLRKLIEELSRSTPRIGLDPLDFSHASKRVLELATDEAQRRGYNLVNTEHLLLGLARQSEGVAIDILTRSGITAEAIRQQTRRVTQSSPVQRVVPAPLADIAIPTLDHAKSLHFHVIEQFITKMLGMVEAKSLTLDQAKELLNALQPQLELLAGETALAASQINHMKADDKRKITLQIKAKDSDASTWEIELPVNQALLMIDDLMVAAANHRAFTTRFEGAQLEVKIHLASSD